MSAEREELERRIVSRARTDPGFLALLLADPRAALAGELGFDLPEGLEVVVVEERPDRIGIVVPVDPTGLGQDAVWAMTGVRPGPPVARGGGAA